MLFRSAVWERGWSALEQTLDTVRAEDLERTIVVRGESLAALPSSVLAVIEADRNGGSFRPLQSALMGEWEIVTGHAVTGSRTLTLPLEE